jgi:RND family efflux transporter MFP subunit
MRRETLILALFSAALLTACGNGSPAEDDHGHEHTPDGGHAAEDDHGHAHDAGGGHGEEEEHGHGGGIVVTDFSETAELFVEFPPFAVGRDSSFAAHFTRLDSFAPVSTGRVTVRLAGGGAPEETFTANPSPTPGIFRPVARPRHEAMRDVTVILQSGDLISVHSLGRYQVFATAAAADASMPDEADEAGLIPFLKEQQWQVDFATAPVESRVLHHSVRAPASLVPAPGGDAGLTAQTEGVVLAGSGDFPEIGMQVERGQVLARITPNPGGDQDYPGLIADREAARVAVSTAQAEYDRVSGLQAQGAVSERRVEEAGAALQTARARLSAAEARLGGGSAGVAVRAPISGRIAQVDVGVGSYVGAGDSLFRIVDTSRLRLVAQVAEIDRAGIGQPQGAWFTLLGGDSAYDLDDHSGRLVTAGAAVDPVRRTSPVIFEFENDADFAAGTLVTARVRTGERFEGPVFPAEAIIDDSGQSVVFVMADGENWRRQPVRIAVRDGDLVGVSSGVEAGDRVATRGAYLIHLAASGPAEAGHGHAH